MMPFIDWLLGARPLVICIGVADTTIQLTISAWVVFLPLAMLLWCVVGWAVSR